MTSESTPSRIRYRSDGSRHGKLLALKSYSSRDPVELNNFVVGVDIVSFLAWKHVKERNGVVIPSLPSRLEGCDFHWDIEMRDDQSSAQQSVRQLVAATTNTSKSRDSHPSYQYQYTTSPLSNTYWTLPQLSASNSYWELPASSKANNTNSYWALPKNNNRKRRHAHRLLLTTFHIIDKPPANTTTIPEPQSSGNTASTSSTTPPVQPNDAPPTTIEPVLILDNDNAWLFPFAITGPTRSTIAEQVSILASAYEMPLVSGAATSASLDNKENHPSFARTIPADSAGARAIMVYFHSIGVTHCANLFSQDGWGRTYNADLQKEAIRLGITMVSFGYDDNDQDTEQTLERLKESGMRYIFAIVKFNWEFILDTAYQKGIIGTNQYVWIGAEATDWTDEELELPRQTSNNTREYRLAQALNGVGSLSLYVEDHLPLNDAIADFIQNESLQQEYISLHPEAFIFENYSFAESVSTSASVYHQMFYDATYSIGLAACNTPGLFTGPELYQTIVHLAFEGVTGNVQFDTTTGTRSPDSVRFRIDNVLLSDERSDVNFTRFQTNLAAIVVAGQVEHAHRYIYYDNTTVQPLPIPTLEHDYHLIPIYVQVLGWILGGIVMLASLGISAWTCYYRNTFVVRASQPVFMCAICVGTFIMAAAIIPMGMQGKEETQGLDAACMATVWMTFLGFVIALAALFSKTWRMNQVMQSGIGMRRIEVQAKDVLGPFVGLMTVNITLLTFWTIFFPLSYIRSEGNDYDSYGRSLESYGKCMTRDGNKNFLYFLVPLLVFDFVGVAVAFYQSYLARTLPTEFSESSYLALSMGCLTETLVLGGPILFAANTSSPTAFFLVLSLLVITTSLAILVPIFVPKYLHRNAQRNNVIRSTILSRRSFQPEQTNPDSIVTQEPRRPAGYMSLRRLDSGSRSSGSTGPRGRVSFMHPASTSLRNTTQRNESNLSWGGSRISGVSGLESASCLASIQEADGPE